jgi:predicted site-specific integrase-resolvase
MQNKICFTQKELARRWTLSHRTLERWRSDNKGPAFMRIGGRIIYRLDDVARYERENLCLAGGHCAARVS